MRYAWMAFLLFFAPSAMAQLAIPTYQDASGNDWQDYYYFTKDPGKTPLHMQSLENSHILDKQPNLIVLNEYFLAAIFADNAGKLDEWFKDAAYSGKTRDVIEKALWRSGHADIVTGRFKDTPGYLNTAPAKPADMKPEDTEDLSALWGTFLATGDKQYVLKMLEIFKEAKPESDVTKTEEAGLRLKLYTLSTFVLADHMEHSELARRILVAAKPEQTPYIQSVIDSIAQLYRGMVEGYAFPKRDGEFSAILSVGLAQNTQDELKSHMPEGMYLKEVHKVKIGQKLMPLILFSGMELDENFKSDVVYDIALTGPDKKTYDALDKKDVPALNERTPLRFRYFDQQTKPLITFEAKDKPGTYVLNVVLKDRVSKKEIPLSASLELEEDVPEPVDKKQASHGRTGPAKP